MNEYNFSQTRVLFTDVHGPILETYLGTEKLRKGSLASLRYLKKHIDSRSKPEIVIVSGDSEPALRRHFNHVGIDIEYGTVEHGLGIKLPREKVLPIYEVDCSYSWLREPISQLAELRRKLEVDIPRLRQATKQFMVAPYILPNMSPEEFQSYILSHVDGFIDLSKFDFNLSHGAGDIKPKGANKRIGVRALKKVLGLRRGEIMGMEDNDFEWLEEVGYACCITPSSEGTLVYVGNREINGTGRRFAVDYTGIVIKQAVELCQHAT